MQTWNVTSVIPCYIHHSQVLGLWRNKCSLDSLFINTRQADRAYKEDCRYGDVKKISYHISTTHTVSTSQPRQSITFRSLLVLPQI